LIVQQAQSATAKLKTAISAAISSHIVVGG
jgi:hypothetical protein